MYGVNVSAVQQLVCLWKESIAEMGGVWSSNIFLRTEREQGGAASESCEAVVVLCQFLPLSLQPFEAVCSPVRLPDHTVMQPVKTLSLVLQ